MLSYRDKKKKFPKMHQMHRPQAQMREVTSNFFSSGFKFIKARKSMCGAKQLICRYNAITRVQIYLCLLTRLIKVCEILLIIRPFREGKKCLSSPYEKIIHFNYCVKISTDIEFQVLTRKLT